MNALVTLAVLTLAAQEAAPPPPQPDAPAATSEAPAPPADVAPAPAAPSAESAPKAAPSEKAPPNKAPTDKAPATTSDAEPGGLGPFMTFVVQVLAGCGTTCALLLLPSAISVLPVVGCALSAILNSLMCLIAGPIIGLVEAVVGDMFGAERGVLLWTILGGYAGYGLGAVLAGIVGAAGGLIGALIGGAALAGLFSLLQSSGGNPLVFIGALFATYGGIIAVALVTALVSVVLFLTVAAVMPAVLYGFTSEPKQRGDTGFRFPGFVKPNHPKTEALMLPDLSGPRRAMAY